MRIKTIIILLLFSSLTMSCTRSCNRRSKSKQINANQEQVLYTETSKTRGLEAINVDRWTSALLGTKTTIWTPENSKTAPEAIVEYFKTAMNQSDAIWLRAFYSPIAKNYGLAFASADEYSDLAKALYTARDKIRILEPMNRAHIAVHLLSVLTDEVLVVMTSRFPKSPTLWQWRNPESTPRCDSKYQDSSLCMGDIVLSKSGALTSLLFLFRSPYLAEFSHADIGINNNKGTPEILEADTVGRRVLQGKDLDSLPLVSIYHDKNEIKPSQSIIQKIINAPPFHFNFKLQPNCSQGQFFCSELIYCIYKNSGIKNDDNPFAERLWTAPASLESKGIEEFEKGLGGFYWGNIPAPEDVEFNPNYQADTHIIRTTQLFNLRAQTTIINAFIQLIHEKPILRAKYLLAMDKIAAANGKLKIFHSANFANQYANLKFIINGRITQRGLAMYAYIQEILLPQVLADIYNASQNHLPLLSELQARAFWSLDKRLMVLFAQLKV